MSNFVSVSSKLNLKLHTGQGSTGKAIYRTLLEEPGACDYVINLRGMA